MAVFWLNGIWRRIAGFIALIVSIASFAPYAFAGVSDAVGRPLQAALAATDRGDFAAAVELAQQAAAVKGLTDEERSKVTQTMDYIAFKSDGAYGVATAKGAQIKFAADYRAQRYQAAINDEAVLRQFGALSDEDAVVIAQSYYLLGDYKGCARFLAQNSPKSGPFFEAGTKRQLLCVWQARDDNFVRPIIVRSLGISMTALDAGCRKKAVEYLQAAMEVGRLNADEQSIVTGVDAYIGQKVDVPDGGETCSLIDIKGNSLWQTGFGGEPARRVRRVG